MDRQQVNAGVVVPNSANHKSDSEHCPKSRHILRHCRLVKHFSVIVIDAQSASDIALHMTRNLKSFIVCFHKCM